MAPASKFPRPAKAAAIYRRGKGQAAVELSSDEEDQEVLPRAAELSRPRLDPGTTARIKIDTLELPTVAPPSSDAPSDSEESDSAGTVDRPSGSAAPPLSESEDESDSDSGETSSGDEAPSAPIFKPIFVAKRNRDTRAVPSDNEETLRQVEETRRKQQSHNLVAHTLLRELADKETEEKFPDVDDTDGLDLEAEFEAWKLRELQRIKRDRDLLLARERERAEVEERRALPEAVRLREDVERAEKSRKDKPKGERVFLQKYHHKGAFYADSDVLKKHDFSAPTESTNTRMDLLPAVMQVRDFGKMSRTKWTHLAKEDTTARDSGWAARLNQGKRGEDAGTPQSCFGCGGPHLRRDCPTVESRGHWQSAARGTNSEPLGGGRPRDSALRDSGRAEKRVKREY